ncbi:MAG TPA: DUF6531 domain-containing protein, partial [Xanthomonadaceae bacterium]|nr:DUF6531 domain-containing protein [Xanthomonadaceae bacterium]
MKYASGWWLLVCLILSISAHATNVVVTPPYTNDSFDTSEIPPTATPAEQSERVWDAITDMWIREGVDLSKCNMTMQYYAIGQYSDGRVERQNYSGSCGGYTTIFGAVNGKGYLLKRINKHPHNGKGCNCVNGQVSAGDPIEIGTGNTYLKETDFNGGDPRLQFSRSYNSNASARNSTVGMGWTSTLDTHVVPFWADMIDPYGGIDTSGVYADPNGACISGFAEIAAKQPEIFAGYSAQWIPPGNGSGPGICGIFNPLGVVTAYWPILSNDDSILLPNAQSPYLTGMVVYRDDGSTYEFTCANGGCLPDPNVPLQMAVDSSGHFLLTDADGVIDLFDSTGSIVSRTWKDRYQQTVSPNQDGTLKTISDTSGRSIALSYIDGFLTTVNTPDGQVISYTQDASGNLLTKHSATGTRTYQYANASFPNNLTGVVDEDTATNGGNPFTTWSYDTAGLANGSAGYGGVNQVSIVHNSDGSATVTDPLNTVRTYSYQTNFGVPAITAISGGFCANCGGEAFDTYDISGYLATATDWNNNVKSYTFASGLLTQLVEGDGTPSKRTTAINWDQVLRNPLEETVTDASNLKLKVDWQYNGAGTQIARCEEDPTVTGATSYVCSSTGTVPAGVRRWTYSYCNAVVPGTQCPVLGLLEVSTDPLGHATSYSYFASDDSTCASNPAACPHRAGDLNTITNPLGQVVTLLAYDGAGRVLKMTDTNNVETDLTYNSRGGLVQIATRAINGQVGPGDQTTSFQYDNAGQLTQVTEGNGAFSVFKYDVAHRLTDIADNLGDDIHYTLDKAGNRMEDDTRDPSGTVKRSVQRVFNNLGQLQIIANANVSPQTSPSYTFSYDPNGNPTGLLNGRGYTTTASFDPLNRIAAVVQDPNVGGGTHVNANTALTLDALDRATVVQDPQGLPTQYNYDGLNDLIQLTSPDTGTTINTFDAAGNLKTRTDARGVKATYVYDVLNRVTAINYTPASTPSTNMSFVYDNTQSMCNQTTEAFGAGRLTQMHNASGTTNFCYDRFGRMVHKQQGIAGVAFVTTYAYDLGNRLIQATTPGGTVINYTRDALGRVTAVSSHLKGKTTFTNLVTNVTYYPYGPVASITYADGRVLTRTYDQNYYINGVTDTANGGLNLTFVPDLLGNIVQENAGSSGNILNYDALNRLTNVNDLSNNPVWAYT